MIYTDEQIKANLTEFIEKFDQHELVFIVPYCLGYYGYITKQIWRVITELRHEGKITV